MNYRGVLAFALLLAAAAGSWLLGGQRRAQAPDDTIIDTRHEGYYVLDASIQGIGSDGRYLYRIDAREIVQADDGVTIEMNDVRVLYSPGEEVPWTLRADRGRIDERQYVILSGGVRAESSGSDIPAVLTTEALEIDPENYVASTDARVTIQVGPRTLSATGMLAFLNEDRIELKSNVSGRFLP